MGERGWGIRLMPTEDEQSIESLAEQKELEEPAQPIMIDTSGNG